MMKSFPSSSQSVPALYHHADVVSDNSNPPPSRHGVTSEHHWALGRQLRTGDLLASYRMIVVTQLIKLRYWIHTHGYGDLWCGLGA